MRILYTTTIGLTMNFFKQLIRELIEKGNTVDIACNEDVSQVNKFFKDLGCQVFQVHWTRSPLDLRNIHAVKELKRIVEDNHYDVVHCHTPIAGVCTRLACRKLRKTGLKVVYTAHGFHFYKGSPVINWLLYYPLEKLCAHYTDVLITINKEDYVFAKRKIPAKLVTYIAGVGIDIDKFSHGDLSDEAKLKMKHEMHIKDNEKVLLSVGELSKRKNHEAVINALAKLDRRDFKYLIVGEGNLDSYLSELIQKNQLEKNVELLGFRTDVVKLYNIADLFVFPSLQEGLPVALMEAIACKTPIICSEIRGNVELVTPKSLFPPKNVDVIYEKLIQGFCGELDAETESNFTNLSKFDLHVIIKDMLDLYEKQVCCQHINTSL